MAKLLWASAWQHDCGPQHGYMTVGLSLATLLAPGQPVPPYEVSHVGLAGDGQQLNGGGAVQAVVGAQNLPQAGAISGWSSTVHSVGASVRALDFADPGQHRGLVEREHGAQPHPHGGEQICLQAASSGASARTLLPTSVHWGLATTRLKPIWAVAPHSMGATTWVVATLIGVTPVRMLKLGHVPCHLHSATIRALMRLISLGHGFRPLLFFMCVAFIIVSLGWMPHVTAHVVTRG